MKNILIIGTLCCLVQTALAQIVLSLEQISSGLIQPVDITHAGDDRLFVVEKQGRIKILQPDGQINAMPFLDIRSRVRSTGSEQGLLGLVFHPDYDVNGHFYVNYTDNDGNTVIARYTRDENDPDRAAAAGEKILLTVDQPFTNHNGGDLSFGPDGYLYIGLGDGGSGGDPRDNGQDHQSLLGKMLRIDVDQGDPYTIPPDNPFADDDFTLDEIWALGLRNPWRFSFDRQTGDLWIADVGQEDWEEINFQPRDSRGGENYGWRCYEGDVAFNLADCNERDTYQFPVHTYRSELPVGCSVTGGFVYRGDDFPLLQGKYLYADFCSGRIWAIERNGSQFTNAELLNGDNFNYVAMGEDQHGELYMVGFDGRIFRIRDQTTPTLEPSPFGELLLSPNPFNASLTLSGRVSKAGEYRLRLFNARGSLVWQKESRLDGTFELIVPGHRLVAGLYYLAVELGGRTVAARRVLKQ